MSRNTSSDLVPLGEATRTWGAIALQTFGGPAGQIAVMQRILVDEKRWMGQRRFLHALNYCIAPAVLAIVLQAVLRVGRRALAHPALVGIAVSAFLALAVFGVSFVLVVVGAAVSRPA